MKKVLAIGLLAICAIALSEQQASAWVNSRFGVGLNWDISSGGNSVLWGAWRNGQPPGPEAFGGGYGHHHHGYGYSMTPQSTPYAYEMPAAPSYAQPMPMQQPFQFATYPRPVYYYPR
ncbi:MAG TPA: hypothetical protein VFE62_18440 [Gemmataceae bacterium]|nr:hypothetical protein [Gemmataceae bacterium]